MVDVIWGKIKNVTAKTTIELEVTHQKEDNKKNYEEAESITISELDIPGLPSDPMKADLELTAKNLSDRFVKCEVMEKDHNGKLLCKVSHSGAGGY